MFIVFDLVADIAIVVVIGIIASLSVVAMLVVDLAIAADGIAAVGIDVVTAVCCHELNMHSVSCSEISAGVLVQMVDAVLEIIEGKQTCYRLLQRDHLDMVRL